MEPLQAAQDVRRDVVVVPFRGPTVGRLRDPDVTHARQQPLDADADADADAATGVNSSCSRLSPRKM
jgi:hypothetical protein